MDGRTTIGTCSLCGGRVSFPTVWHAITPPPTTCESCGVVRAEGGPVVPMRPVRNGRYPQDYATSTGTCYYHRRYC